MSAEPEQAAEDAITDLLSKARNRSAVCAALMRLSGQALARLTSHDQASTPSWPVDMPFAPPVATGSRSET